MNLNEKDIAERIKGIKLSLGLSISELAREIGIAKSTMNSYLQGNALPPKKIVSKLSSLSRVKECWIYHGEIDDYIYKIISDKGYTKFIGDYPEAIYEIIKNIDTENYPNSLEVMKLFMDYYKPKFKSYIVNVIIDFSEEVQLFSLLDENLKSAKDEYNIKVIAIAEREKIKYGDEYNILKIAKQVLKKINEFYKDKYRKNRGFNDLPLILKNLSKTNNSELFIRKLAREEGMYLDIRSDYIQEILEATEYYGTLIKEITGKYNK